MEKFHLNNIRHLLNNLKSKAWAGIVSVLFVVGFVGEVWGQSQTFSYTGNAQTFVVPAGVTSIDVKIWGAGGGGHNNGSKGGAGAFVKGTLPVTSGESLTIIVGGGGLYNNGSNQTRDGGYGFGGKGNGYSASGGGLSGIFIGTPSQSTARVIAGGGGGGNSGVTTSGTGGGNSSTSTSIEGVNGNGGGGGGYQGGAASKGGSSLTTNLSTGFVHNIGSSGTSPGGTSENGYVSGVGKGGESGYNKPNGGNGLVIISYVVPTGPDLSINSINSPVSICQGSTGSVTVNIKNDGDALGASTDYKLQYQFNGGAWVDASPITYIENINAGNSEQYIISLPTQSAIGTFSFNVRILKGVDIEDVVNSTIIVKDCSIPDLSITGIEPLPSACINGEEVIKVNIFNSGAGVSINNEDYMLQYSTSASGPWTNGVLVTDLPAAEGGTYEFVYETPSSVSTSTLYIRLFDVASSTVISSSSLDDISFVDCDACPGDIVTTSGSGNIVIPANVTKVTIEAWGGGGGGGNSTKNNSSGGGGGGAYAATTINNPSGTISYTVGSGGGANSDGSTSSVSINGGVVVEAEGGKKGSQGTGSASGGAGGSASNSIGDIRWSGGKGGVGRGSGTGGGGGGGGAGTTGNGGNGNGSGSSGGSGGAGNLNGNGAAGRTGSNGDNTNSAQAYGGGGGGTRGSGSGSAGANGLVRITFSCELPDLSIESIVSDPNPMCLDQEGEIKISVKNNSGSAFSGEDFELEYSFNNSVWQSIASIANMGNNATITESFNFTPTVTGSIIIYVRLRNGGTVIDSRVISVTVNNCNPPADANCEDATWINTNSTYIGNTADYNPNPDTWLNNGANTIENVSYFKFIPTETTISFEACAGCSSPFGGIQFFIFTECGNVNSIIATMRQLSTQSGSITTTGNLSASGNKNGCSTFTLSGLTIGQTYYWAVDGFEGSNCPYSISFADNSIVVLPIELTSFTGHALSQGNLLKWSTASEKDNDYFTLYSSVDGYSWREIAEIDGAGNSQTTIIYEFLDRNATPGVTYYKLRQTDYDGEFEEFDIISVVRSTKEEVLVHPNPSDGNFKVSYYSPKEQDIGLVIYDNLGKPVYNLNEKLNKGVNSIAISLDNVTKGVYFLNTVVGEEVNTQKIIVN